MKIAAENFAVKEPQWILDRTGSGPLHWRRESAVEENNSRVKFRFDVQVKEFQRSDHELEEAEWTKRIDESNNIVMSFTYFLCLAVTLILPFYIIMGKS